MGRWVLTQLFICFISCCYQRIPAASIINRDFYLGDPRYTKPLPEPTDEPVEFPSYDPTQPVDFGATVIYSRPASSSSTTVQKNNLSKEGDVVTNADVNNSSETAHASAEPLTFKAAPTLQSDSNEAEIAALAAVKVMVNKVR